MVGGAGKIRIFDGADGMEAMPPVTVQGIVRELSAAGGSLFVGTDAGYVYCLRQNAVASVNEQPPAYSPPYPIDDPLAASYTEAAQLAAAAAPSNKKGFCLVLGAGEGRLAYAISQASDMTIVRDREGPRESGLSPCQTAQAGVYGRRVSILVDDGKLASCPGYLCQCRDVRATAGRRHVSVFAQRRVSQADALRRCGASGSPPWRRLDLGRLRGSEMSDWEPIASTTAHDMA